MKNITLILFASIALIACKEIIAEDLTGKLPTVILPSQNDTIQTNPVHFKWNKMDGATNYHLMVVSPSFTSINAYVLDTFIIGTDFFFGLDSNVYEMKLTANNAGYTSDTINPIKFWVGVQPMVTSGVVQLSSPLDSFYVSSSLFNNQFQWSSFLNASSYQFELRQGANFSTGTILEIQNNISTNVYTSATTFSEGEYKWGVKAYFIDGTSTNYSVRNLFIDDTAPNIATLSSPLNLVNIGAGTVSFAWSNGTDSGIIQSPIYSFLEIASDVAFANIVYSNTLQASSDSTNLSAGTYYWRVTNTDAAGNSQGVSSVFQLTVF